MHDHVLTKMYKLLMKFETEEEPVKECMVKRAKNVGHMISVDQWEKTWTKGLTLHSNLKDTFYTEV